jgi:hypothetical protein
MDVIHLQCSAVYPRLVPMNMNIPTKKIGALQMSPKNQMPIFLIMALCFFSLWVANIGVLSVSMCVYIYGLLAPEWSDRFFFIFSIEKCE